MRVLFTAQPASGHLHPLVPLALAARAAGHDVRFALGRSVCPAVERHGFEAFPAGLDMDHPDVERVLADPRAATDPAWAMSALFAGLLAERMLGDLSEIVGRWRPDVVVSELSEFASWALAEKERIPNARVLFGIYTPPAVLDALAGAALEALRRRAGLGADPGLMSLDAVPQLVFAPRGYQPPHIELPPTAHVFRPAVFDQSGSERLPDWISGLPDRPLVYATLGTAFNETAGVLETAIDALRDENLSLVVTVGRNRDPGALGPLPANVRVERYIPQSLLLPHCDAVVCHGGYGTVMAALSYGLPMVLTPIAADQPLHAERCRDLGVGLLVERGELTAARMREAILRVLENPTYGERARAMQDGMIELPGMEQAVGLLEATAVA